MPRGALRASVSVAACARNETPVRNLLAAPHGPAAATGRIAGLDDILDFGRIILVVAGALSIAIFFRVARLPDRPPDGRAAAAVAAIASELSDRLAGLLTFEDVQRVADARADRDPLRRRHEHRAEAGSAPPPSRSRSSASSAPSPPPPLVAVAAHYLLGFDWTVALLIGAALAPTDPAVTFSVLAGKEVEGRSGTILEGESGFNDPVGIALMIGMIELATTPSAGSQMSPGSSCARWASACGGAVAGVVMLQALRRVPLPGRLAVPAGGDARRRGRLRPRRRLPRLRIPGRLRRRDRDRRRRAPGQVEVRHFQSALADLGELAVFVALGLTVDLGYILAGSLWWRGPRARGAPRLRRAAARDHAAAPAVGLRPRRAALRHLGRAQGRGADPARLARRRRATRSSRTEIYGIVFVVVLFSVVVQGTLVPRVAERLGVPMTDDRARSAAQS